MHVFKCQVMMEALAAAPRIRPAAKCLHRQRNGELRSVASVQQGAERNKRTKGRPESEGRSAQIYCAGLAYFCVHSRLTRNASFSFSFQCAATSFANGSSCDKKVSTISRDGRRRNGSQGWVRS